MSKATLGIVHNFHKLCDFPCSADTRKKRGELTNGLWKLIRRKWTWGSEATRKGPRTFQQKSQKSDIIKKSQWQLWKDASISRLWIFDQVIIAWVSPTCRYLLRHWQTNVGSSPEDLERLLRVLQLVREPPPPQQRLEVRLLGRLSGGELERETYGELKVERERERKGVRGGKIKRGDRERICPQSLSLCLIDFGSNNGACWNLALPSPAHIIKVTWLHSADTRKTFV